MATNDTVKIQFEAITNNLSSGLQAASGAVSSAVDKMQNSLSGLNSTIVNVSKAFLAFEAIKILKDAFESIINTAEKFDNEIEKMSMIMGINSQQATVLSLALQTIGSSTDGYISTYERFARQLKNNEELMNKLGLTTRDANGHLLDTQTVFDQAVGTVGKYKAGIDQTIIAQTLFGRSIDEVIRFQRLNNDIMVEAKQRAEDWGLTVTGHDVQASREWEAAQAELNQIMTAFAKVIAEEVEPILVSIIKSMGEDMPAALAALNFAFSTLKVSLLIVLEFFNTMSYFVKILADILGGALASALILVEGLVKSVADALSGNFKAAVDDVSNSVSSLGSISKNVMNDISTDTQKTLNKLGNLNVQIKNAATGTKTGGQQSFTPAGGTESAPNIKKLQQDIADANAAQKKSITDAQKLRDDAINQELKGEEHKLTMKKLMIQQEVDLGTISKDQQLHTLQSYEDESYNIELAALQKKLQLAEQDPDYSVVKRQKILDDMLDLQRKHEEEILRVKNQTVLEEQKFNIEAEKSISDSFGNMIDSIVSGQKSLKDSLLDFVNSIQSALSKLAAQSIAKQLFGGEGAGGFLSGILGGGGGGGGGIGSIFGSSFGGGFASGGDITSDKAYLVGEQGPELFLPSNSGTIVPNNALGGGGMKVINNFTINGQVNTQSQQQIAARVGLSINRAVKRNT